MAPDMEENPGSFLATTGPTRKALDLSTSNQDAAQAVKDGLRDAKAANTRRAYASAWNTFLEWTLLTGRRAMSAAPQAVALGTPAWGGMKSEDSPSGASVVAQIRVYAGVAP